MPQNDDIQQVVQSLEEPIIETGIFTVDLLRLFNAVNQSFNLILVLNIALFATIFWSGIKLTINFHLDF